MLVIKSTFFYLFLTLTYYFVSNTLKTKTAPQPEQTHKAIMGQRCGTVEVPANFEAHIMFEDMCDTYLAYQYPSYEVLTRSSEHFKQDEETKFTFEFKQSDGTTKYQIFNSDSHRIALFGSLTSVYDMTVNDDLIYWDVVIPPGQDRDNPNYVHIRQNERKLKQDDVRSL